MTCPYCALSMRNAGALSRHQVICAGKSAWERRRYAARREWPRNRQRGEA